MYRGKKLKQMRRFINKCGSGSHCFVAENLGRKYIGIELDKNYFNVATERMGG